MFQKLKIGSIIEILTKGDLASGTCRIYGFRNKYAICNKNGQAIKFAFVKNKK